MDFEKNHSTVHPVLHLLNDVAETNNKSTKDITLSVFLDLSKAFDTINHATLLKKLEYYGIRGICNKFFANYLHGRSQYMEINGHKSLK